MIQMDAMIPLDAMPLVRARIDLTAIRHNVCQLKAKCRSQVTFMAVVKADGYGHGAVEVARAALESGAQWLGVARLHEAVELRHAGIMAPILIFGYVPPEQVPKLLALALSTTVYNLEMATALSEAAVSLGKPLNVHVKIDTGMGRVGLISNHALDETLQIAKLEGIRIEGVYTHFASADSRSEFDQAYTRQQIDRFEQVCATLLQKGIDPGIRHAANSAGIIEYKRAHLDMVRAGISLYGLYPSGDIDPGSIALMPAMSLEATITSVREVPKGFKVSYGMTYETKKATRLASVPAGYADGYSRLLSSKGEMLVHGKRAPICGRVCMDQTLIDVGHIQGVKPGDTATLIGTQNGESVTADDLARLTRTINYEVVSSLTSRVGRVYSGRDDSGPDCA